MIATLKAVFMATEREMSVSGTEGEAKSAIIEISRMISGNAFVATELRSYGKKDLIFNGDSAESPTRSRSSTDRIWPSEG